ncbi:hypothetical protein BCT04_11485 [Vibrio breoganii]|uniref:hypothetical protein n=1 Tax=Vibrio breoganii TaxID=553239 RepID=UPI000C834AC0|nr:hypothetical protein [Vibrio breoganii]PML42544.1 hypothetical protein BCT77_17980 [Vibrio breoganii]PMO66220.1 hypothetical protein BCT04_11485 [Vibrio breoganii]
MNLKVKGLVLAVVSALVLNGCDSDKVKAELDHAGHKIGDAAHEVGHKIHDEVERAQGKLTQNAEKESLRQLGLDEADIDYVIAHNPDDAMAVAKHTNDEILYQTKYNFVDASGQQGGLKTYDWNAPLSSYYFYHKPANYDQLNLEKKAAVDMLQETDYKTSQRHEGDAKANLQKMLGRVAFVINSPKFIKMFNDNYQYLYSDTFSVSSAYPNEITHVPDSYNEFKADIKSALSREGNTYKFYAVKDLDVGDAKGDVGKLSAYFKLKGMANSKLKASAPLVLHELTHTFGYQHAGADQNTVKMKPNNVPYLVQLMTMDSAMQDQYQGDMQMFSNSVNGINQITWYAGDSMFSTYFGND